MSQKRTFFNKDKLLENFKKENDNKNVIFMKYEGKIYPFKLELTKVFKKKNTHTQSRKTKKYFKHF